MRRKIIVIFKQVSFGVFVVVAIVVFYFVPSVPDLPTLSFDTNPIPNALISAASTSAQVSFSNLI